MGRKAKNQLQKESQVESEGCCQLDVGFEEEVLMKV